MNRLMVEENAKLEKDSEEPLSELPKPCDCFDLIGGTSTGGCVALYIYDHLISLTRYTIFVHYRVIATLTSMANLASTYWDQGRWKEAETLEVVVMEKMQPVLGNDHPDTLASMANLASIVREPGALEGDRGPPFEKRKR
jgi:hypothetical protein